MDRFTGGSPEWLHQARIEAIRQGFDPADISIEWEDLRQPVMVAMPEQMCSRLKGKAPEEPPPTAPPEPADTPAPGYRP